MTLCLSIYSHMYYVSDQYNSSMNNKHLTCYKEINNNFIIASRAYFLHEEEDPLCRGKVKIVVQDSGAGDSSQKQKRKVEPIGPAEATVLNAGGRKFKGKPKLQWKPKKVKDQLGHNVLDLPCYIHTKNDEEGNLIQPKHTEGVLD